MAADQPNLKSTFPAPPVGQLIDELGMATQRFLIWLNILYRRFLILRANLVPISSNYAINFSDCTLRCILTQPNPIILTLPDPSQIQGQFYWIKNDATSVSTVSFAATANALIDNAPPSSVVLAAGQAILLESDGTNWIKLALFANSVNSSSPAATSTNSGNGVPSVPLGPGGVPSSGQPIPPGTPVVSALPAAGDPLAEVGVYVIYQGKPYIYTAGVFGGLDYWALDTTGSPSIRDTWANLSLYPAASYPLGTVFVATDRSVSYAIQQPGGVNTWIYFNGIYQAPLASIPVDLDDASRNFVFRASDYLHSWVWSGSAWSLTTGGLPPGTLNFANPGPPLINQLWQLCDGSTVGISQNDATVVATTVPTVANQWIVR